jgi:hypothetical protein
LPVLALSLAVSLRDCLAAHGDISMARIGTSTEREGHQQQVVRTRYILSRYVNNHVSTPGAMHTQGYQLEKWRCYQNIPIPYRLQTGGDGDAGTVVTRLSVSNDFHGGSWAGGRRCVVAVVQICVVRQCNINHILRDICLRLFINR